MADIGDIEALKDEYQAHDLDEVQPFREWAEKTLETELTELIEYKRQEREFEELEK